MSQNRNISYDRNSAGTGYPSSSSPPPPSYAQATTSGSQFEPVSSGRLDSSPPTHDSIAQLLRRLPLQVRNARQDQLSQQNDDEHRVVECLAQYIAEFIRNIPTSVFYTQKHQRPLLAELILVPADAVPATQGWVLSDLGQRKANAAHVRVVEVNSHDKEKEEYTDRKDLRSADETSCGGAKKIWRIGWLPRSGIFFNLMRRTTLHHATASTLGTQIVVRMWLERLYRRRKSLSGGKMIWGYGRVRRVG